MATRKKKSEDDDIEDGNTKLPYLEDGELATVMEVVIHAKETKPPLPYTEATLLGDMAGAAKFLEEEDLRKVLRLEASTGIGTAATRAPTIEGLKKSQMLVAQGKTIDATPKAVEFVQWVESFAPDIVSVKKTALWQLKLNQVAIEGGGKAFEGSVIEEIRELVSKFKAAPRLRTTSNSSTEGNSMSENSNKPTEKQIAYAVRIATKLSIELPEEVRNDFDKCREFIDQNKDAAMRPSDKQLAFAARIAKEKGVEIPEAASKDGAQLSRWIDENK